MNKILLALVIGVFSVGAFACGGNGNKDKEDKKFETITRPI